MWNCYGNPLQLWTKSTAEKGWNSPSAFSEAELKIDYVFNVPRMPQRVNSQVITCPGLASNPSFLTLLSHSFLHLQAILWESSLLSLYQLFLGLWLSLPASLTWWMQKWHPVRNDFQQSMWGAQGTFVYEMLQLIFTAENVGDSSMCICS